MSLLSDFVAFPSSSPFAGLWLRFVAILIDSVILCVLGFFLWELTGSVLNQEPGGLYQNVLNLGLGWLYFSLFESSFYQASPGKQWANILVTDVDGNRLTFLKASGRHLAKALSILPLLAGFLMAGFTEKKQGLHDMLTKTLVIRK
jgi:uncharacterized RDD family membrane protein YckC